MNDVQPYPFEPEGTLEEEDDSDSLEKSGIIGEPGNTHRCLYELCDPMYSKKESVCCHSKQNLNCVLADSNVKCILQHPEWLR